MPAGGVISITTTRFYTAKKDKIGGAGVLAGRCEDVPSSQPLHAKTASKLRMGGGAGFYRFPACAKAEAERCQAGNTIRRSNSQFSTRY